MFRPNRLAVYAAFLAGIAGAVVVPLANLDLSSTASVIGGVAAISAAVYKFLDGWQAYEARVDDPSIPGNATGEMASDR
jgi:hypothetical protein